MGILPFFEFASSLIRCKVIDLFIQNILPLGKEVISPHLQQIILSFLPAFEEENSDFYQKAISLFEVLEGYFGRKEIFKSIWSVMIMSSKHRLPSINYIIKKQPKKIDREEIEDLCVSIRTTSGLPIPIVALKQCLSSDSDIMVIRGSLDIICLNFPLSCPWLSSSDKECIIESMLSVLIRRDMTLSRRVFTWVSSLDDGEIDLISSSIRKMEFSPKVFKIISYLNDRGALLKSILQRDLWYILESLYDKRENGGDGLIGSANKFFSLVDLSLVWGLIIGHFVAGKHESLEKDISICCWSMDNLLICEEEAISEYIPMFAYALKERFSPIKDPLVLPLFLKVVQEIKTPDCCIENPNDTFDPESFIKGLPSLPKSTSKISPSILTEILKDIIGNIITLTFYGHSDIDTFLIIETLYKILRASIALTDNSNVIIELFKGFPQRLLELNFDLRSMFAISKFVLYCNDLGSSIIDSYLCRMWDLLLKSSDHTGSTLTDDSAIGIGSNVTIILLERFPEKIDKFLSGKLTNGSEDERVCSLRIISHLWFGCIYSLGVLNSNDFDTDCSSHFCHGPNDCNTITKTKTSSESSISLISSNRSSTASDVDLFPTTISIILEFLDDKHQSNGIKSASLSWYYRAIDHLPRVIDPLILLISTEISNSSNYSQQEKRVTFLETANLARIAFCFKQFIALLSVNDGSTILGRLGTERINKNLISFLPSKNNCSNLEAIIQCTKPFLHCNVDNYNLRDISLRLMIIILERCPRYLLEGTNQSLVTILQNRITESIVDYEKHPMVIYCLELLIAQESSQYPFTELVDVILEIFRKIDSAEVLRVWVACISKISPSLELSSLQRLLTSTMIIFIERVDEEIDCHIAVPSMLSQRGREMWILDILDALTSIIQISRNPRAAFTSINSGNTTYSSLSTSMENTTSMSSHASISTSTRKEDRTIFLKTSSYVPSLLISISKLSIKDSSRWLEDVRGRILAMIDMAPGRFIRTLLDHLIELMEGGYTGLGYNDCIGNGSIEISCSVNNTNNTFGFLLDPKPDSCWIHCDLIGQLESVYPSIREAARSDSGSLLEGFILLLGRLAEECGRGGKNGVSIGGVERHSERIRLLNLLSTAAKDCMNGKISNFKAFSYLILNAYLELLTEKNVNGSTAPSLSSKRGHPIRVGKDVILIFNRACELSLTLLYKAADSSIFNVVDLNSIVCGGGEIRASVIIDNIKDSVIGRLYYVVLWKLIPSLSLISFEDDKITSSLVSSLCNQVILPSFKGSNRLHLQGIISQVGFSMLCKEISLIRWWKKDFWDTVFMDTQLFHGWCLPNIMNQIVFVMKEYLVLEPDRLSDMISKVPSSSSSTLFVSKEMDNILRAGMIRRLSVLVISSDLEALKIILPLIQEKIVDVLRLGNNNWSSAEVFTLVKCLLFKMGNTMTTGIWPVVSTESLSLFKKTTLKDPSVAALYTWLCVCRLLEFVLRTGYPTPLMYIWPVVEIIERCNSDEIPVIVESMSKLDISNNDLEYSGVPKEILDNISGRNSILPNTNIYSIDDLAPFFKYISWRVRNSCDSYSDEISTESFEKEIINSFSDNIGSE